MSYEGYDEILCKNGHLDIVDAFDNVDFNNWKCEDCGEKAAWWTAVDITNALEEDEEFYPGEVRREILEQEKYETCNLGHRHMIKRATYKIPTEGGHKL